MQYATQQSREALAKQHAHRRPDEAAQRLLGEMRQRFLDLAIAIDALVPPSRERSLAFTNLDQARQWACNAITLNGEIVDELDINSPMVPAE